MFDDGLSDKITGIDAERGEYPIGKLDAHIRNVPHLAVSIFVFRGEQLLLQRRAVSKYHSGGLWANTVCSHPLWMETPEACAARRLHEELGFRTPLQQFARLDYAADVGDGLYENERVHCFVGDFDELASDTEDFNRDEVSEVAWVSIADILERLERQPESFSAWFRIYMIKHRSLILPLAATRY